MVFTEEVFENFCKKQKNIYFIKKSYTKTTYKKNEAEQVDFYNDDLKFRMRFLFVIDNKEVKIHYNYLFLKEMLFLEISKVAFFLEKALTEHLLRNPHYRLKVLIKNFKVSLPDYMAKETKKKPTYFTPLTHVLKHISRRVKK